MNYKFKIGDIVCYKRDYEEYKKNNNDYGPYHILVVTDYVETSKDEYLNYNERRKILLSHDLVYVVRVVITDCGSGLITMDKIYVKEEDLVLYTDEDDELYIQEVKETVLNPNWEENYNFHVYPATEDDYDEFGNLINDGYLKWLD